MNNKICSVIKERLAARKADRANVDNVLQELSEFITPNRGDFMVKRATGERRDSLLFDNTGVQSNVFFASSLQTGLTSPFTQWFNLRIKNSDPALREDYNVQVYLDALNDALFDIFNSPESGFNQQNHQLFLDLGAYGTAAMFIDAGQDGKVRFNTRHLSEIYIEEDHAGVVNTVYREFEFTAKQVASRWGMENLPRSFQEEIKRGCSDKHTVYHCVMPKAEFVQVYDGQLSKKAERFDFVSYYFLEEEDHTLEMTGFHEFPFVIPRWDVLVGEIYGRGPGWQALADIRMANVMMETMLRSSQKAADPPLMMADDGVLLPLETMPGGVNIGGVSQDGRPLIQPLVSGARLDINDAMVDKVRDSIRRTFFVDTLIDNPGRPQQTATEVMDRRDIRFQLMGPQLSRLRSEYLDPLINRVFALAERAGLLPEPPAELDGVELAIEYTSPLIRTQKMDALNSLNQAIQTVGILLQNDPSLLENVNGDETFRAALNAAGFPMSKLRSPEELQALRQQRAQSAQMAQAEQQANIMSTGADAISKLKNAEVI